MYVVHKISAACMKLRKESLFNYQIPNQWFAVATIPISNDFHFFGAGKWLYLKEFISDPPEVIEKAAVDCLDTYVDVMPYFHFILQTQMIPNWYFT